MTRRIIDFPEFSVFDLKTDDDLALALRAVGELQEGQDLERLGVAHRSAEGEEGSTHWVYFWVEKHKLLYYALFWEATPGFSPWVVADLSHAEVVDLCVTLFREKSAASVPVP